MKPQSVLSLSVRLGLLLMLLSVLLPLLSLLRRQALHLQARQRQPAIPQLT